MKLIDAKLIKFLAVGILNTIVGAGIMFLLYNCFKCSYWLASSCNYIFGGVLSFILNKYFTFNNKQKSIKQIIEFILTIIICYLIAYIAAKNIIHYFLRNKSIMLRDNVAMITGMCLYTGLNYIAQRFFIFRDKKNEQ